MSARPPAREPRGLSAPGRPEVRKARRPAALLLEVVIALTVLVAAMGLLGAQLVGGLELTHFAEDQFRASLIADQVLNVLQLDPTFQEMIDAEEELEWREEYRKLLPLPPEFTWRVLREPVYRDEEDGLQRVLIQVLRTKPDQTEPEIVRQIGYLKAPRATVDLAADAGLSEDMLEQIQQMIPIPDFDPHNVDLQQLVSMLDPEMLALIMPMIQPYLQQLGINPDDVGGMLEDLAGGQIPDQLGGNDLADQIRDAINQQTGGQPPGLQPPAGGRRPARSPPMAGPGGNQGGRGPGNGGRGPGNPGGNRGGRAPTAPPAGGGPNPPIDIGRGSGPNGEYTIEDLMRLRDAYEAQQRGGR